MAAAQDLALLQQFLNERGCNAGVVDGEWGSSSQGALDRFLFDTTLTLQLDAGEATLAAFPKDAVCKDHFVPIDLDERQQIIASDPELTLACSGTSTASLPFAHDETMPDGASGIVYSDQLGDVSSAFGKAALSCWSGSDRSCQTILSSLGKYASEGGMSYSGSLNKSSSQFTDTRLEVNIALIKMLGAYLVAKPNASELQIEAIEDWLTELTELFAKPVRYFQDTI